MSPILIPRDTSADVWNGDRPSWRKLKKADGTMSASVCCAKCGKFATLTGHTIAADGTVTPSLDCPHDGCNWHVHVWLEGWKG